MPTFPIPVFVACVLGFASLRLWLRTGRVTLLVVLLMLCAGQSLIIALSQHYGVTALRWVQPLGASVLPPVAWLAYRNRVDRSQLVHALGPVIAVAALIVAPGFLDVALPGLFVLYGAVILVSAKTGGDAQPDALLASGDLPARIWQIIGMALIASALSDVLIAITQALGHTHLRLWIISVFSAGNLLIIGGLGLSPHLQNVTDDLGDAAPEAPIADVELWARIQAYMTKHQPYLDPDLTLARLSRKMAIPAKQLSATINAATGENVSRYINAARISAAQDAMRGGMSVTNALLMSGFNTKSNFNREFLRVVGTSPSVWLNTQKGGVDPRAS